MSGARAEVVRTLWHGAPFTVWEELSVRSFLRQGHPVEVFCYDEIDLPAGAVPMDGREILPESEVFSYADGPAKDSFAAFSNLFRAKLLLERGGIWADLDLLCMRPLTELPAACAGTYFDRVNGALLRFPPGNALCRRVYEQARDLGPTIPLGEMSELPDEGGT